MWAQQVQNEAVAFGKRSLAGEIDTAQLAGASLQEHCGDQPIRLRRPVKMLIDFGVTELIAKRMSGFYGEAITKMATAIPNLDDGRNALAAPRRRAEACRLGGPACQQPLRLAIVAADGAIDPVVRTAFAALAPEWLLESYPHPDSAIRQIVSRPPHAVLLDCLSEQGCGIDCIRRLKRLLPGLAVVACTLSVDPDDLFLALAVGAVGYLIKPVAAAEWVAAVREVCAGGWYFCRKAQAQVGLLISRCGLGAAARRALSPRENQIIAGLLQNRSCKEIAARFGISEATVYAHLSRMYKRFQVHGRQALVGQFLGPG